MAHGAAQPAATKPGILSRLEEALVAFLLAAMTLITFMQVVARYVFNYSFVWALELTTFLFAGLIFIGISYGVRVGAHIGIDVLTKKLRPTTARVVLLFFRMLQVLYGLVTGKEAHLLGDEVEDALKLAQAEAGEIGHPHPHHGSHGDQR